MESSKEVFLVWNWLDNSLFSIWTSWELAVEEVRRFLRYWHTDNEIRLRLLSQGVIKSTDKDFFVDAWEEFFDDEIQIEVMLLDASYLGD